MVSNADGTSENFSPALRAWRRCWLVAMMIYLMTCWYGMMVVHEAGHMIGAWLTGGVVERVVLHPLAISRTDLSVNPHPLIVVWSGPLLGCMIPLMLWLVVRCFLQKYAHLARFFAGFCCATRCALAYSDGQRWTGPYGARERTRPRGFGKVDGRAECWQGRQFAISISFARQAFDPRSTLSDVEGASATR